MDSKQIFQSETGKQFDSEMLSSIPPFLYDHDDPKSYWEQSEDYRAQWGLSPDEYDWFTVADSGEFDVAGRPEMDLFGFDFKKDASPETKYEAKYDASLPEKEESLRFGKEGASKTIEETEELLREPVEKPSANRSRPEIKYDLDEESELEDDLKSGFRYE